MRMSKDDRMNILYFIRDFIPEQVKIWEAEHTKSLNADLIPDCFGVVETGDNEGYNPEDIQCRKCILIEACGKWVEVYSSTEAKILREGSESQKPPTPESTSEPEPEPEVIPEPEPLPEPQPEALIDAGPLGGVELEPEPGPTSEPGPEPKKKAEKKPAKKKPKKKNETVKNEILKKLSRGVSLQNLEKFVEKLGRGKSSLTYTLTELRKLGKLEEKNGKLYLVGGLNNKEKLPRGYIKKTILEMLTKGTTRAELDGFIKKLGQGNLQLNKTLSELRKSKKLVEKKNGSLSLKK